MAEQIDRPAIKAGVKEMLRSAQVSPKGFVGLYLLTILALNMVDTLASSGSPVAYGNPLGSFVSILTSLLGVVLQVGFILYCMDIRRGIRSGYLTLFDGFSFAGRVIGLAILRVFFVFLWSLLFLIPGIVAIYRYRFAYLNLCENPELGCMDALELSKKQTAGYKGQLFMLDLSYLGWGLLASFPFSFWASQISYRSTYSIIMGEAYITPSLGSVLVIKLLLSLWALAVEIFYIPVFQCAELEYYEIAKRTSGVYPISVADRQESGDEDSGLL
ncbi:DUF975 family protein [Oscillibacter sp.]|uniref:DUF975 family protein n=1 Tax=Oscillibacter sp. TaxID=1945593 RepID=UPI0028AD5666|nr:DUF975 family protein [Oscillibacter sp.]